MIRLTLLRGIGLVDASGHSVDAVVRQPKRLALLAYLSLAGCELGSQRDALLGLFWPELTPTRARQALNAATHFLRQHLGQEILVNRGPDALALAPGAVWCDAAVFAERVAADPEGALQLYAGDLLPGFYIDAGHEFERWLDEERRHLRGLAADAARRLAQRAAADGDMPRSIRFARRLVDLADNDEILVGEAMTLMAQAGDRSGALDVYGRFASRLSEEYPGARPSAKALAIVERIRSYGTVSVLQDAPVTRSAPPGVTAIHPASDEVRQASTTRSNDITQAVHATVPAFRSWLAATGRHHWAIGLVSGVTLGGALLLTAAARSQHKPHRATSPLPRVEIVGFTALDRSAASAQTAAMLSTDITDRLTRTASLDVVERRGDGAAQGSVTPDLIAKGSVLHSGTRLVIDLSLVDGRAGTTVRTAKFESADSVLPTADTLSTRIAQLIQATLHRQIRLRRTRESLHDERLYRLVQDAEEDRARSDTLKGQGQPQPALRALADADTALATVERAAPTNAEVRTLRSSLLQSLALSYFVPPLKDPVKLRATLTRSMIEADTAMLLDTTSADAAEAFASAGGFLINLVPLPADSNARVTARIERALHHAIAIDPLRPRAWTQLSLMQFFDGDFAGSYDAARHAYDTDAFGENGRELLSRLSDGAYELGDDSASAYWCAEMQRKYPHEWTSAYCRLKVIARTAHPTPAAIHEAWQLVTETSRVPALDPAIVPHDQLFVATALAHAGLRDSAAHIIARVHASSGGNVEMWPVEAEARVALGEQAAGDSLVHRYVAVAPARRVDLLRSRRYRPLPRR